VEDLRLASLFMLLTCSQFMVMSSGLDASHVRELVIMSHSIMELKLTAKFPSLDVSGYLANEKV
jgi:hypothetical protein